MTDDSRHFDILSNGLKTKTWEHSQLGIAHAELHLPYIDKTVKDLAGRAEGRTCLVVSGGPSVLRRRSLERLKPIIDRFVVVCADGAMGHCLRADIVPDYVVSVDPGYRIVRWFGDDKLDGEKLKDDYFRRQDLDSHFNADEIARNEEQTRLVDAAGPRINAVLSTSASEAVRDRSLAAGMNVYWWNPIYDDVSDENSITRSLYRKNKVPCMNTGGNVGTSAVILAARVLGAARAVMIGMDFSYYADTPIERSQYYDEFRDFMTEAEIPHAFKTIRNPYRDEDFYTDPAYFWYREAFLELVGDMAGCEIVNATEGGILFGDGIVWQSIDEVVSMMEQEETTA